MKRALGLAAALLLLLAPPAPALARDGWAGTYEYTANLGRTAGGTVMLVTYTVEVTSGNARLGGVVEASGYMTDSRLRCDTRTEGNRLNLYFHSYPDGGTANQYGVELYRKGDLLLSLERIGPQRRPRYRVVWGKLNTDFRRRVFFRKTA